MRASWTDINGRKVVITNVHEIREMDDDDKIEFRAKSEWVFMKVYIDGVEFMNIYRLHESCRFIDSEIVLSADKEIG